jgi:4-hydroxythreonine-4-phosphate dehydrogenase
MTMGDPAGVGPSITVSAWEALRQDPSHAFFVIGAPGLYSGDRPVETISTPTEAREAFSRALPVLPLDRVPAIVPGKPDAEAAGAIIASIEQATAFCLDGSVDGMVTNPINKALLYGAGFRHPGHTEFVAALCEKAVDTPVQPVMLLTGGGLRVALATIHVALKDVFDRLNTEDLVQLGEIVGQALRTDFGIASPRLAFTGLNPHAGENGTIGREEIDIINPAAETLRAAGIDISDARSADTVFAESLDGRFDAVIAMTHDQGLIPVKTLDMWGGVNTTLGLPIVRTSPDHGTGYDAAASGTARADSLIAAIRQARMIANNRKAHR